MPDESGGEQAAFRQTVAVLTTTVAVLTEAVNNLRGTVLKLQDETVQRGEFTIRFAHVEEDVNELQGQHRDAAKAGEGFRRSMYLTLITFGLGIAGTLLFVAINFRTGVGR